MSHSIFSFLQKEPFRIKIARYAHDDVPYFNSKHSSTHTLVACGSSVEYLPRP